MKNIEDFVSEKIDISTEYFKEGKVNEAIYILEELLPQLESDCYLKIQVLGELNGYASSTFDYIKTIEYCSEIIDTYNNNIEQFSGLNEIILMLSMILIEKANAHVHLGGVKEAIDLYKNVIDIFSNAPDDVDHTSLMLAYNGLGHLQLSLSKYSFEKYKSEEILLLAKENLTKAIEINPIHYPSYTFLAETYFKLGNNDKSEKLYEKSILIPMGVIKKDLLKETFYKYKSIDKILKKNLKDATIFLNKPKKFNDPFDCPVFRGETYKNNNPFSKVIDNVNVSCFSDSNRSILMWSHYADSHKGICIEYNINDEYLCKNKMYFNKIIYKENHFKNQNISEFNDLLTDTFCIKHIDWKYENEYRLINYGKKQIVKAPEIISITFGLNCDIENREKIYEILKNSKKIKFYQVIEREDDFININVEEL